jgi:hypothetical protein
LLESEKREAGDFVFARNMYRPPTAHKSAQRDGGRAVIDIYFMKANHEEYNGPNLFIENVSVHDNEETVINGMLEDIEKVNKFLL